MSAVIVRAAADIYNAEIAAWRSVADRALTRPFQISVQIPVLGVIAVTERGVQFETVILFAHGMIRAGGISNRATAGSIFSGILYSLCQIQSISSVRHPSAISHRIKVTIRPASQNRVQIQAASAEAAGKITSSFRSWLIRLYPYFLPSYTGATSG